MLVGSANVQGISKYFLDKSNSELFTVGLWDFNKTFGIHPIFLYTIQYLVQKVDGVSNSIIDYSRDKRYKCMVQQLICQLLVVLVEGKITPLGWKHIRQNNEDK